jgi:hypothetical protein
VRLALATVVAAALALGSGCGGGDGPEVAPTDPGEPAPVLPSCAAPDRSTALAVDVDLPLPPGTVLTSSESPFEGQIVVLGLVPADLQETASFFNDTLPDHGYRVGIGDAEGNESEAPFTGNGYRGKWRVNSIPDCAAVRLTLVLIEQP